MQFGRHLKVFSDSRESGNLVKVYPINLTEPNQGPTLNVTLLQAYTDVNYNSLCQHFASGMQFGRHLKVFSDSRESGNQVKVYPINLAEPNQGPTLNVTRLQAYTDVNYNSLCQHFASGMQFGRHLKLFSDSRESGNLVKVYPINLTEPNQGPPPIDNHC
jgi:hypothetical protein